MACLVAGQHLGLAGTAMILHVTSRNLSALNLTNHCMRDAVGPNAEHPVPSVSHRGRSIAAVLLSQAGLIILRLSTSENISWHLGLLAKRMCSDARVLLMCGVLAL